MALIRLNNQSISSVTALPSSISAKGVLSMNTTVLASEHSNTTADYADGLALTFTPVKFV